MTVGDSRHLRSTSDIISNDNHLTSHLSLLTSYLFSYLLLLTSSIYRHAGGIVDGESHRTVVGNTLAGDIEGGTVVY